MIIGKKIIGTNRTSIMSINGITVVSNERYNVCYIDEFTEELKDLIKLIKIEKAKSFLPV